MSTDRVHAERRAFGALCEAAVWYVKAVDALAKHDGCSPQCSHGDLVLFAETKLSEKARIHAACSNAAAAATGEACAKANGGAS